MKHVRTDQAFGLPRLRLGLRFIGTAGSDTFDRPPPRRACPYCGTDHWDEEFGHVPCQESLARQPRWLRRPA